MVGVTWEMRSSRFLFVYFEYFVVPILLPAFAVNLKGPGKPLNTRNTRIYEVFPLSLPVRSQRRLEYFRFQDFSISFKISCPILDSAGTNR